jgi:hypothetical protein
MRKSLTISVVLVVFASLLVTASPQAADSPVGTWLMKAVAGKPETTLTIEAWGKGGGKLTWRFKGTDLVMTVASAMDGADAPVLFGGKPSGETMAIKLVDKLHSVAVVKMNGKPFGTSKATFSPDFKTMTVVNDFTATVGGNTAGKSTETWVRK